MLCTMFDLLRYLSSFAFHNKWASRKLLSELSVEKILDGLALK